MTKYERDHLVPFLTKENLSVFITDQSRSNNNSATIGPAVYFCSVHGPVPGAVPTGLCQPPGTMAGCCEKPGGIIVPVLP
ncbi:MAG: hypothetical protein NTV68_10345 [Methanomicrobiales archaeon]|nr:hypothetical protein [Methanomicrobiales archaeon]